MPHICTDTIGYCDTEGLRYKRRALGAIPGLTHAKERRSVKQVSFVQLLPQCISFRVRRWRRHSILLPSQLVCLINFDL